MKGKLTRWPVSFSHENLRGFFPSFPFYLSAFSVTDVCDLVMIKKINRDILFIYFLGSTQVFAA